MPDSSSVQPAAKAGSHLGVSMGLAQERGGDQEFPLLQEKGICLVQKFPPPPPSASVEEEQVHQEEWARSPGSKQDAETQRQRKDFPQLPPLQWGAKQRAAQVKGGHPSKELKWVTWWNHSLKHPQPAFEVTVGHVAWKDPHTLWGGVWAGSQQIQKEHRHQPTPNSLFPYLDSRSLLQAPIKATN